jgi:hypothetical protein
MGRTNLHALNLSRVLVLSAVGSLAVLVLSGFLL